MNILNMAIPILMHILTFICQRPNVLHQTEALSATENNYGNQSQASDVGAPTVYRRIYWCKFFSNQT